MSKQRDLSQVVDSIGASKVGYIVDGSGAVTRTAQDKMRESVSVLDFFANGVSGPEVDPTGVIDSTLGIQAALNKSFNVHAPAGTYLTTKPLVVDQYTTLYGDGEGATIIQKSGNATVAEHLFDSIVGLVDVGGGAYNYGAGVVGIALKGLSNNAYGLKLGLATHGNFENVTVNDVVIGVSGTDVWLTNYQNIVCRNSGAEGTTGFSIAAGTSNTFTRCWSKNFAGGYDLGTLNYSVLNGCACDSFTSFAYSGGAAITFNACGAENANLAVGGFVWGSGARSLVLNSCQCLSISTATSAGQSTLFKFIGTTVSINNFRLASFAVSSLIDLVTTSTGADVKFNGGTLPTNYYRKTYCQTASDNVSFSGAYGYELHTGVAANQSGFNALNNTLLGYEKQSKKQVQGSSTALTPAAFTATDEQFTNTYSIFSGAAAASVDLAQYTHSGTNSNSTVFIRAWIVTASQASLYQGYGTVINGAGGAITLTNVYGSTHVLSVQFNGATPNILSATLTTTFAKAIVEVTINQRNSSGTDSWLWA